MGSMGSGMDAFVLLHTGRCRDHCHCRGASTLPSAKLDRVSE